MKLALSLARTKFLIFWLIHEFLRDEFEVLNFKYIILYFGIEYSMLITNVLNIETLDAIILKSTFFSNIETVIKYITGVVFNSKIQI